MAIDSYSELEEIKKLARQIAVGDQITNTLSTITPDTIEHHQKEVDDRIDSILDPIYEVPLVKVKRRDGTSVYPSSIRYVANRMTAAQIVLSEYSEIDSNSSGNARRMYNEAEFELYGIVKDKAGASRLEGQRTHARIPFISPEVYPRADQEVPKDLP